MCERILRRRNFLLRYFFDFFPSCRAYSSTLVNVLPSRIAPFSIIFSTSDKLHQPQLDLLVLIRIRIARDQPFRQKHLHAFAQKAGAGVSTPPAAAISSRDIRSLLRVPVARPPADPRPASSLPAGSSHRNWFAACRYCRSITTHGSFLLLRLVESKNHHAAVMPNHIALSALAAGLNDRVVPHLETAGPCKPPSS